MLLSHLKVVTCKVVNLTGNIHLPVKQPNSVFSIEMVTSDTAFGKLINFTGI